MSHVRNAIEAIGFSFELLKCLLTIYTFFDSFSLMANRISNLQDTKANYAQLTCTQFGLHWQHIKSNAFYVSPRIKTHE